MLVEVRVRLEGPLAEIVDRANAAIKEACALFTGLTREQVAVHYYGIHEVPRVKSLWLRYMKHEDKVITKPIQPIRKRIPSKIIWAK